MSSSQSSPAAAAAAADGPKSIKNDDNIISNSNSNSSSSSSPSSSSSSATCTVSVGQRRKDMFGDCALVEIIHLHDCLRGALKALERDVSELSDTVLQGTKVQDLSELERRVAGRFKVIWSVFRAHSSAEDEFIWPTLQSKTQGRIKGSPSYNPASSSSHQHQHHHHQQHHVGSITTPTTPTRSLKSDSCEGIEQGEYEEDHADEERMFSLMDDLLTKLRTELIQQKQKQKQQQQQQPAAAAEDDTLVTTTTTTTPPSSDEDEDLVQKVMKEIHEQTKTLSEHLMAHLAKEEKQCLPLVVKHLSKSEIHDLVGKIMGKRSSDMIAQIMTMAVQNLNEAEREEMVKYMKQAMAGTFFDRWLSMSGWMKDKTTTTMTTTPTTTTIKEDPGDKRRAAVESTMAYNDNYNDNKRIKTEDTDDGMLPAEAPLTTLPFLQNATNPAAGITSQAELEKLIRAIATNPNLSPQQKNTTIQGLRDSVWKSNQRLKGKSDDARQSITTNGSQTTTGTTTFASSDVASAAVSATATSARRVTPPSMYYKKNAAGKLVRVWGSDLPGERCADDGTVPFFSASELAPTYHDGATGAVLGCPHYARACKLRHPVSGRLYTCRLCCEQEREMPSKDQDEPLDRYAVTEVMCMKCNTLQPAEDRCVNPACESHGRPFAKYFCRICHLYDDRPRPIFHCPYCNTCRMGLGLGIDFRHCMRCNACVSLTDDEHRCIPQKLQGSCPICHETLFQSTQPLRGLKCGHVMHLSCFTEYRRGQRYTCPLCMRCMEDMSDYFALLDAAVRMQPMPYAYLSTMSNVYCQDCEKTGQCRYHFVGQKCPHCGSYNTREMGRVQAAVPLL